MQQLQLRAAAVACSSCSHSSVRQAASCKINEHRGTAGRGELHSTTLVYEAMGTGAVAGSISIQIQQQLRAASSSSDNHRAAAATESSLVQARKSGLTQANIDLQPPSMVVLQARAQLLEMIIARHLQNKRFGDWQPPFMVVLKTGEHNCRMTHAKTWKGKNEHFGIIFQPHRFGVISRLWLLLLREGLRCPSQQVTKDLHTGL
jgi:hypothetical protein